MKKTKPSAILLVITCTFFTAVGMIFYKLAADKLALDFLKLITNYHLFIGMGLYGLGAILLIYAYKNGELSTLFPFISLSYIWVALLSMFILAEVMSSMKWIGIIAIIAGVIFIGYGSK